MDIVEEFIQRRFPIDCNWTAGNCYFFAKILQSAFPDGSRIWYELYDGHFVCEIDRKFYDWNGQVKSSYHKSYIPWDEMEDYDINVKRRIIKDCIL